MKAFFITVFIALAVLTSLTACERNKYQHPMHRK